MCSLMLLIILCAKKHLKQVFMLGKFHVQGYHAKCNPFSRLSKWVCTLKFILRMVKDPFHSQVFTPFTFT